MAITWTVKINPLNIDKKEANIIATRIDDTDILNIKTETHTIISAVLATSAQKSAALDQIWQMHLDKEAKQIKIAAYIGDLENQAKIDLEAREA